MLFQTLNLTFKCLTCKYRLEYFLNSTFGFTFVILRFQYNIAQFSVNCNLTSLKRFVYVSIYLFIYLSVHLSIICSNSSMRMRHEHLTSKGSPFWDTHCISQLSSSYLRKLLQHQPRGFDVLEKIM